MLMMLLVLSLAVLVACGDDDSERTGLNAETCVKRGDKCNPPYEDCMDSCGNDEDCARDCDKDFCDCLMDDGNVCDAKWDGDRCVG